MIAWIVVLVCAGSLDAEDQVTFKAEDQQKTVVGKVLVKAADGGLLLLGKDGVISIVQPQQIVQHTRDDKPFEPLTGEALAAELLRELPEGFQVYSTAHYTICYNTSRAYAQWCGSLYERLYMAFTNFWKRKGIELQEPELPLVAIVFEDTQSYRSYARRELGEAVNSVVGYYSLRSNRVLMYDLTGVEALRQRDNRRGSPAQINRMLSSPQASPMVATIVHEATHQIAFNCGMHTRYADIPLWVSEGLAVYFETPDLTSSKGWKGIGNINRPRLAAFKRTLQTEKSGLLASLIASDRRIRNIESAADAYAQAWALNYYLIRYQSDQYVDYLKMLSKKKQMLWSTPEKRIAEFQHFFGKDIPRLESKFLRTMQRMQ